MTDTQICLSEWPKDVQSRLHTQMGQSKDQCSARSEVNAHCTLEGRSTGDSVAQLLRTQKLKSEGFNQHFLDLEFWLTHSLLRLTSVPCLHSRRKAAIYEWLRIK